MRNNLKMLTSLALAGILGIHGAAAWPMVTAEDQKLIDAADCAEIIREYRNFSAAEKKVEEHIRQTTNSTVAGNVLGVATLATFGLGFFSWDDHSDAKTNLAELTAYRVAIGAAGKKKACSLPDL